MPRGPRPRRAAAALLLLLLLAQAGRAAAQDATQPNATTPSPAPAPTPLPAPSPAPSPPPAAEPPVEPLPAELRGLGWRWLDQGNASLADFTALHPAANTTFARIFLEGAWDFLNDSRLALALTQLYQAEVTLRFDAFFPDIPEAERRGRSLALVGAERNASAAALDAFTADLLAFEARARTTHAVEYALYAASTATVADALLRAEPNTTKSLAEAPAAEERVVRVALLFAIAPGLYARWASDVLALAVRVDAEAARPALPPAALATLQQAVRQRLAFDPDARSTTGPSSNDGLRLVQEANRTGPVLRHLARFVSFEAARATDALGFLEDRNGITAAQLQQSLALVMVNATFVPAYDGRVAGAPAPGPWAQARIAGYQDLLGIDARNQAGYRIRWDATFEGLQAGWSQLVAARYAAETLAEAPSPSLRPGPADGGSSTWLLYGGVAVVAALAVAGVALLRRPGTGP